MKIESVKLSNYKGYLDSGEVILSEKVNVFIGRNDSGKSAFVNSLRVLANKGNEKESITHISDNQESELLFKLKGVSDSEVNLLTKDQVGDIVVATKISKNGSCGAKIFDKQKTVIRAIVGSEQGVNLLKGERPDCPIIFFDSERYLTRGSGVGSDSSRPSYPSGENFSAILDELFSDEDYSDEYKAVVEAWFGKPLIKAISNHGNTKIVGRYAGGRSVKSPNMGTGTLEIIYLIINLIMSKNKTLVLEEIERSVQPDLMKKVLEFISKKVEENNLQILLTTHSNIVLRHFGADKNNYVFKTELKDNDSKFKESKIFKLETGEERRAALYELGYELSDLDVFDGFIIVEESTAQRFLKDVIFANYFPGLSQKLGIIASDGAGDVKNKFKALNDIFLFLHVQKTEENIMPWSRQFLVLVDGDDTGKNVVEELKKSYSSEKNEQYREYESRFKCLDKRCIEYFYPEPIINEFLKEFSCSDIEELLAKASEEQRNNKGESEIKKRLLARVIEKYEDYKDEIDNKTRILQKLIKESFGQIK